MRAVQKIPHLRRELQEANRQNGTKQATALNERRKTNPELDQRLRSMHSQIATSLNARRKLDPELDHRIREAQAQNGRRQAAALNARRKTDAAFAFKVSQAASVNVTELNCSGRILKDAETGRFHNHKVVAVREGGTEDVFDFQVGRAAQLCA